MDHERSTEDNWFSKGLINQTRELVVPNLVVRGTFAMFIEL
jgi:hypothetical protein